METLFESTGPTTIKSWIWQWIRKAIRYVSTHLSTTTTTTTKDEVIHLLLYEAGNLMRQDKERAVILSAFLVFIFADMHSFQKSHAWRKDEMSWWLRIGLGNLNIVKNPYIYMCVYIHIYGMDLYIYRNPCPWWVQRNTSKNILL